MKSVVLHDYGEADKLSYEEIDRLRALPGEIVIRVKACAVNYIDLLIRRGVLEVPLPHILGVDSAGIVEETEGVSEFKIGDRVLVNPRISCVRKPLSMKNTIN